MKILCVVTVLCWMTCTTEAECAPKSCASDVHSEITDTSQAQVLIQTQHARVRAKDTSRHRVATNPSGAGAPLNEEGYFAVADRCCQAEMKVFISRQVLNLGLEICDENGLHGIVPYHSCEAGPQTFAKLTADLLENVERRCTWIAKDGECKLKPEDCPEFGGIPPLADCGCHNSDAVKVRFDLSSVTENNLGGAGPTTGPEEIRYSNAGTTSAGVKCDLVVTTLSPYNPRTPETKNGITEDGHFGCINQRRGEETSFKFSFVVPGTNTPLVVPEVHMATFDLDGDETEGLEYVSSKGYKGYVTDAEPSVVASRLPDGRTKFTSSGEKANLENPTLPDALTVEQRRNSVMYFYTDVSSFEVNYGIENIDDRGSRNLFFAFESSLEDRCGD